MRTMARTRSTPGRLAAEALYQYALRLLSRRSHTRAELERKLMRRCAREEDIPDVLDRLRDYGYLDDASVAASHSALRREAALVGPKRVLGELRRRGIDQAVACQAVADEYDGSDELSLAREHLRRKLGLRRSGARIESRQEGVRLFRALLRAGFSASVVATALGEVAGNPEWLEPLADAAANMSEDE